MPKTLMAEVSAVGRLHWPLNKPPPRARWVPGVLGGGVRTEWRHTEPFLGLDIHPLLYVKQVTSKDLLLSTGNSTQYPVRAYMGTEPK